MDLEKLRVLSIDDNKEFGEDLLIPWGRRCGLDPNKIVFETDPKKALLRKDLKSFHLIFLDYGMPELTGLDVLKKLKGNNDFKAIPVIILSTGISDDLRNKLIESGASDIYLKMDMSDVEKFKQTIATSLRI